ncbi:MAG: thioredoxin domain-containing protein, partial [Dehalococcoidia bacterium]|nr:thioredoxin domain-containing protein [Dehalococcoidia bacterium]
MRVYNEGQARVLAYLEDYANLCDGLIALYETTFDRRWLAEADRLAAAMLERFWDDTIGGFYDTAVDHESLIIRPRDVFDNATPAGGSVAVDALLRLALLTGNDQYRERATTALARLAAYLQRAPSAFGRLLCAFDFAVSRPKEIAIIGDPDGADTAALLRAARRPYAPNKVIALGNDADPALPLLAGKTRRDGQATAYVCHQYVCQAPTTDPAVLLQQLTA